MLNFKAGMFSWSVLTVIVLCANPAFAEAIPSDNAAQSITPTANDADAKNKADIEAPKTGSLELSDSNVQFLKSFNDRHKCGIANIDAAISRADFANNIVVCLTSTEVKLAQDSNAIPASELAQLKDIVDQFSNEVSYLGNRVETVEKKLATVQKASSFSTTTKLAGEVIVALTGNSSQTRTGDANRGGVTFADRVRINFDTTFTGKDRLRTRLESRNIAQLNVGGGTGTNTTRLGFDGNESNGTRVALLQYTLPISNNSRLIAETVGTRFNDNFYTFNPFLTSSGSGAISRFGRYNPVYRQGGEGAGIAADVRLSPEFSFGVGYAIPNGVNPGGAVTSANDTGISSGVFGGNYAGIAQLRYQPSPSTDLGLIYSRSYHNNGAGVTGSTGSLEANNPFNGAPTVANHYNFLASTKLSPGFTLSGWVGLTNANIESGGNSSGNADIINAAITAAFTDVGAKGNTLGFIIGLPPRVTNISSSVAANNNRFNPEAALHLEGLYKIRVSENLDITPGVLLITNPESAPGAANRGSEFVGTVRTTFKF